MQDTTPAVGSTKLDEIELIDELKRLRTQIPDNPSLNPILNVAFDLSRRLESGAVSFDEMKGLAGRLMDRACVRRARRLREKIGYVDQASTLKDFTTYVEKTANEAGGLDRDLCRSLVARPHRHRSDRASDLRSFRRALSPDGRDRRLRPVGRRCDHRPAASPRAVADAAARAQVRARCHPQSAQRLRRAAAWVLQRRLAEIRRRGIQAPAEADDVRVLGRLRPRRPHRHRMDVLVPGPPARKARGACRHPRAFRRSEAQARRRRRGAAHRRARSSANSISGLPRSTSS